MSHRSRLQELNRVLSYRFPRKFRKLSWQRNRTLLENMPSRMVHLSENVIKNIKDAHALPVDLNYPHLSLCGMPLHRLSNGDYLMELPPGWSSAEASVFIQGLLSPSKKDDNGNSPSN